MRLFFSNTRRKARDRRWPEGFWSWRVEPGELFAMPARTSQIAQVGKRQIELSNLTKVLYPDEHITKAHLIEFYLKIAPTILAHVKGRPLSLVRFPDGI